MTPVAGFTPYVSYAEGYRAPSITETLIAGEHATGGGPAFFPCPGGTAGLFCFLPNPGLRPEVGKNKEAGVNLKYNDIFTPGDSFRGKFNVFRNDVDDYIDLVGSTPIPAILFPVPGLFSQFYQYQNIAHARIEGVEAETMYDAGGWFVGVAGHLIRGKNTADQYRPRHHYAAQGYDHGRGEAARSDSGAVGAVVVVLRQQRHSGRLSAIDRLRIGQSVPDLAGDQRHHLHSVGRQPLEPVLPALCDPGSLGDGTTQNDVLFSSPGPGTVYKAGLKIHLGGA